MYTGWGKSRLTVVSMQNTEFIPVLSFVNYCIVFHMNIVFHIVFFTVVKLLCPTLYVQRICIALSIDGHLGCFRTLAIVDNAAVNVLGHISFQISGLDFFRLIPGCGIAGSYDISIFNFFRNLHNVFHSGYVNLQFHQQCMRAPFFPHNRQHLFTDVLMGVILTCVRCFLIVVLIALS